MSNWPSTRAKYVLKALIKIGWKTPSSNPHKKKKGSHLKLTHASLGMYPWAFPDDEEIGPKMLARIAKHTGLRPEDL